MKRGYFLARAFFDTKLYEDVAKQTPFGDATLEQICTDKSGEPQKFIA
jgi:hypothetical protein